MIQTLRTHSEAQIGSADRRSAGSKRAGELLVGTAEAIRRIHSVRLPLMPTAALFCALTLVFFSIISHQPVKRQIGRVTAPVTASLVVARGGSLWQLASQYGDPKVGMQERVEALAELNGVRAGAPLIAGQKLLVPILNPTELALRQVVIARR